MRGRRQTLYYTEPARNAGFIPQERPTTYRARIHQTRLLPKLQNPKLVRLMEPPGPKSGTPGEEGLMGAIAAIKVDAPALARRRPGFCQGLERNPHLAGPNFPLFVHTDLRFEVAAPGEIALRKAQC